MLRVCPPIIIQNTSISHNKRQIFNRAPNLASAPRLCTIQNTSNSKFQFLFKSTPKNTFLQNSSQWLLSQMPVIFLERPNQKQFFTPPLHLIRLKSCNCIKIKILLILKRLSQSIYLSNFLLCMKYKKPLYASLFL